MVILEGAFERELARGVMSSLYELSMGTAILSRIAPYASVPLHEHIEAQFGLCLDGAFTMQVGTEAHLLEPGGLAYLAQGNLVHGAVANAGGALAFDLKFEGDAKIGGFFRIPAGEMSASLGGDRCVRRLEPRIRRKQSSRITTGPTLVVPFGQRAVTLNGRQIRAGSVASVPTGSSVLLDGCGVVLVVEIDGRRDDVHA